MGVGWGKKEVRSRSEEGGKRIGWINGCCYKDQIVLQFKIVFCTNLKETHTHC